jgi:hypothetical protein
MSRKLADAFRLAGGKVDCHVLAAAGSEDRWRPETEAGVKIASAEFDRALKTPGPAVAKKR